MAPVIEGDHNHDDAPGDRGRPSLPGRGAGGSGSPGKAGKFRALPVNPREAAPPAGVSDAKRAPAETSPSNKRIDKRLKPVKVVNVPKAVEPSRPANGARGPLPAESRNVPPEQNATARALREKERVLKAAGLVSHQKLARIAGGDDVVFRCPACSEQNQCVVADCGSDFSCSRCGAVLWLPEPDAGEWIKVVSLPKKKAGAGELPPLELPGERSSGGRSREARFQAIDELLPDAEEGGLSWGLEKSEMAPEKRRRAGTWLWFAVPLFLLCAAILVRQIFSTSGRAEGAAGSRDEAELVSPSGEINWDTLPAARKYLLVDQTLRAYLQAPDLETKAARSRWGRASLDRMSAYYQRTGVYEPETRVHGAVSDILLQEEKVVGGKFFQIVAARFAGASQGVYALERTSEGYLVDWEYSEGYGEMSFAELAEKRPAQPVLLRVHLSETSYFADGFDEATYRAFNMVDPFKQQTLLVFVPRHSEVEEALARAWNDAVLDSIGDPTNPGRGELDFVLRVRHENESNRKGFVIDEVIMRGWIVPHESK